MSGGWLHKLPGTAGRRGREKLFRTVETGLLSTHFLPIFVKISVAYKLSHNVLLTGISRFQEQLSYYQFIAKRTIWYWIKRSDNHISATLLQKGCRLFYIFARCEYNFFLRFSFPYFIHCNRPAILWIYSCELDYLMLVAQVTNWLFARYLSKIKLLFMLNM